MDIGKFITRGIADTLAFGGALVTTENPVAAFEAAQAADAVASSGYDWFTETFGGTDEEAPADAPVTNNPHHIGHYMGRSGVAPGHGLARSQQYVTAPVPVNAFSWGSLPLTAGERAVPIGVETRSPAPGRDSLPPQVSANFLMLSKK